MHLRLLTLSVASLLAGAAVAQTPGGTTTFGGGRGSVTVEALYVWFKASPTPVPLITDDYANAPAVNVLLGGGTLDTNANPGFRVTGTWALDSRRSLEGIVFFVPDRSTDRSVSSTGTLDSIDLLLPFFDVTTNAESYTEISFSPEYRGAARESLSNDLGGGELNFTWALAPQGGWNVDVLAGLRFLQLSEDYQITTESPYIPPNPADIWTTTDQFDARNRFWGAQVGVRARYDQGPWVGSGFAKVALGNMQQRVSINGYLATNDFNNYGAPQTFSGGYFALTTNSGDHSRNAFAVVPELGGSVGYRLTPAATVFVGYSFLYLSNVVRPGEQINRNVNPSYSLAYGGEPPVRPAGSPQPSFSFNTTDFWAQSVSLGLSVRF